MSSALRMASLSVAIVQVPPELASAVVVVDVEAGRSGDLPGQRRRQLVVVRRLGLEPDQTCLERPGGTERVRPDDAVAARVRGFEVLRSEERRVGKECRSRWSAYP